MTCHPNIDEDVIFTSRLFYPRAKPSLLDLEDPINYRDKTGDQRTHAVAKDILRSNSQPHHNQRVEYER